MIGRLLTGMGALLAIAGAVFTLQGIGLLKGSSMTGVTGWAVVGPIIAIVGLTLVARARRSR
jgi:hypothetical protein